MKKVLYAGEGDIVDLKQGSKVYRNKIFLKRSLYFLIQLNEIHLVLQVTFHFKTFKSDEHKTEIDCSRKLGQPFELLIGRKFKFEAWEELVKTMRVKEIARFTCHKSVRFLLRYLSTYKLRACSCLAFSNKFRRDLYESCIIILNWHVGFY